MVGWLAEWFDIGEPVEAEIDRLRSLALRDELTGLANRRAFLERMQEVLADAVAGGPVFSLVLLDLDGLKDINDTFDYLAGDRALQEFAAALAAAVRAQDLVARIGGDEFAVVARHASAEGATALLARLRQLAQGMTRTLKPHSPPVVLSAAIGHAVWRPQCATVEAMFAMAESELAAAKASPPPLQQAAGAFRPRGRRTLGEELRSLLAMARQVTTADDLTTLLRRATEQAAALVGAQGGAIALVSEDGIVRITEIFRNGGWTAHTSERPLGAGVLGRTAATGTPELHNVVTPDLVHDWTMTEQLGIRSVITVPLRDQQGATFGVLALANKRGGQGFREADTGLAQAFADLAAAAIENARSVAALEEAHAALRSANGHLRALAEHAADAILRTDLRGAILDANAMAETMLRYDRAILKRMRVTDFIAQPEQASLSRLRRRLRRGGHLHLALRLRRGDQTTFHAEVSVSLIDGEVLLIVRDVEDRLAAEAEIRRRNEELEARNEVAAILTGSQTVPAALNDVLPIVVRAVEADGALVMLAGDDGRLRMVAGLAVPRDIAAELRNPTPDLDRYLAGIVAAGRTPVIVNDVTDTPVPLLEATRASPVRSIAVLPLLAHDRTVGLLAAGSLRRHAFDEERVARLRALADQIAIWLDGRRLLEEATLLAQDARFLADLGEALNETRDEAEILRRLARGLAAKLGGGVIVVTRDPGDGRWRPAATAHADPRFGPALATLTRSWSWTADDAPAELVQSPNRAILLRLDGEDLADAPWVRRCRSLGVHAALVALMAAGEEILGVIIAGNHGQHPPLTSRHLALTQEVAQHAAVAVANARAFRDAEQSRLFLRAIMDQAGEAMLICDAEHGRIVDANAAAERLTGRNRDALIGCAFAELVGPRDRWLWQRLLIGSGNTAARSQHHAVVRVRRASGGVTVQLRATRVATPNGAVVAAVLRGINADHGSRQRADRRRSTTEGTPIATATSAGMAVASRTGTPGRPSPARRTPSPRPMSSP